MISTYQQRLAEHLRTDYQLSERVYEAFARVPRHPFVSQYYLRQVEPSGPQRVLRQEFRDDPACWYLLNGKEFESVERAVSRYLLHLVL